MYISNDILSKLVELFTRLSFNNDQIKRMLRRYRYYKNDVDRLEENYLFYASKMKEFGYSEFETIELVIYRPRVMFTKFYRKHDIISSYKEYLKNIQNEIENESTNSFEYDEIIKILKGIDTPDKIINTIFNRMNGVIFLSPKELEDNIKFLFDNGLNKEDLVTIINRNSKILTHSEEDYQELLDVIKEFDMDMRDIVDIFRRQKKSFSFKIDQACEFFKWALSKKINNKKFKTNIKKSTYLLQIPIPYLDEHFDNFLKLGFNEEETVKILSSTLSILTYDYDTLKNKIDVLDDYNLTIEQKIKLVVDFPGYLTMGAENIAKKIQTAYVLGLLKFIIQHPSNLIQSSKLTIARAYYLRRYHPEITGDLYARKIYTKEELFIKQFGVSNTEVLILYRKHLLPHLSKNSTLKK